MSERQVETYSCGCQTWFDKTYWVSVAKSRCDYHAGLAEKYGVKDFIPPRDSDQIADLQEEIEDLKASRESWARTALETGQWDDFEPCDSPLCWLLGHLGHRVFHVKGRG